MASLQTGAKENYYLDFNKDEVFKSLIACEGHFRNLKSVARDSAGFLNCIVKHLADAEGHCDEAISHSLIVDGKESSQKFLELRDEIRTFRKWIQSSPVTREEGILEIRKLRRTFESFNEEYDVSKCQACGDTSALVDDLTKMLKATKKGEIANHPGEEYLLLEQKMAERFLKKLSKKHGIAPPKLKISEKCHEPNRGIYSQGVIYMCQSGINLHVLAHEFKHHLQKIGGKHLKEDEAETYAIELFKEPSKRLYAHHAILKSDRTLKTLREVGLIYGGDSIGVALRQVLLNLDARYPGWRFKPSLIGAILGAVGGAYGALNLDDPWDLLAPVIGGYIAMDLYRHVQIPFMTQAFTASNNATLPSRVVYTTQNNIAVKPAAIVGQGKYRVL